jgi:hypothetical protein
VVFLKSPAIQLVPIEATALAVPIPGAKYTFTNGVVQTYEDYTRQGWVLQDIYQAIAWWQSNEFDWWNRSDVLQKLNLPTLINSPIPTPTITNIPTETTTIAPFAKITISPATGLPGSTFVINGTAFPANAGLTFLWDDSAFSPFTSNSDVTDAAGRFSGVFLVPPTASKGAHTITVTAGDRTAVAGFIVVDATTTTTTTPTTTTPIETTTPVQTTTPGPIPQYIEAAMQGAPMFGYSYLNYTKYCNRGEIIEGFVQLTGTVNSVDNSYEWQLQILGPGGESVKLVTSDFRTTDSVSFRVVASYAGEYRIRITHRSAYARTLIINVTPAGWGYKNLG